MSKITDIIENLSVKHVLDQQVHGVDWDALQTPDLDGWEAVIAEECDECEQIAIFSSNMGSDEHRYITPEIEIDGETVENECLCRLDSPYYPRGNRGGKETVSGLACNYWPCDVDDLYEAAETLYNAGVRCVSVVRFEDGTTGLARFGNDDWELCAAYVALGEAPPMALALLLRTDCQVERDPGTPLLLAAIEATCKAMEVKIKILRETASMIAKNF